MRRRSYGQKLLNFLVSELSKTPHTEMSITGIINKPFFETNGFVVGHEEITLTRQLGSEQGDANALSILAPSKLIHLYNEAFHPHPWYQPFENAGDVADHLGASGFIMKGKDGGFAGIIPTKTSIVIEPFGVAPEAQGKGVGKRFLHDLLTWLADNGYKTAKLTIWKANQPAWNLYTKAGFEPVSTNQFWKRTINP